VPIEEEEEETPVYAVIVDIFYCCERRLIADCAAYKLQVL
jgi:hypothetical protein